jgi:CRISPR-associated endonuclease/helicase Cas3
VGTIDQALFATLNVKHHFVRLWGLANRVVVLDEVHAYDTYTGGLIEALLRWLKALNCSVVLMSATLPARKRADLLRAWDAAEPEEIPYPRLLVARGGGTSGAHVPCRPLAPIEVSGLAEDLAGIANAAAERLSSGGCGAVILNTVQRAQELYRLLRGRLCQDTQLVLLHARFPGDERSSLEQRVLAMFGHGERAQRPDRALLVATQVAEQSLDIDFDFMLSDLAPIDLLLQRTGRLHRHKRGRPAAHAKPRLAIAGLLKDRPPELQDTAWGYVYDPYILYCTWRVAGTETTWQLPEDIDRLVQAVYSGDPFAEGDRDELAKTMDRALGEHFARTQHERQLAANVAIDGRDEPQIAYQDKPRADEEGTGHGIAVVTRLGQDSVTVVPVHVTRGGWRLRPGDPPFAPDLVPDDELARRIYARQLRLSRKQVVLGLAGEPAVAAFEEHPLLRHFKPLPLADGAAQFGNLRVVLDPNLGIVYETLTSTEIP